MARELVCRKAPNAASEQRAKSMRVLLIRAVAILVALGLTQPTLAQQHYEDLEFPKLNKLKSPKPKRVELDNGMLLFLVEDHELPLVNLSARIGVGSIDDPAEKIGLASLTGEVMRSGGTKSMTGDEMDEVLESIAAHVETHIGETSGSASMSVLKEHVDTGLSILADVLMNPAFDPEKLDLAQVQQRGMIARRNDDAGGIAGREFDKLIYGAASPYARQTEYATIDAITRDDLISFHRQNYHPDNIMIAVWGDFETAHMVADIADAFAAWKSTDFARAEIPAISYEFNSSVNLVVKEDINQAHIFMGHIGGLRNNPDYFALTVMNDILGGSFTSRLFVNVRSRLGLAYSVFGRYSANYDYPGTFYVGCQTKAETMGQALKAMRAEVQKMTEELVTVEELDQAKASFLNSFVFNFDTRSEVVNRIMTYEYYGYPKDFLQKTKENIEKVTREDVLRVAKKYLRTDALRILVVGNAELFDEPLSNFGEVTHIDISIPVVEEEVPEATESTLALGKELLARAVAACGGDAFDGIESLRWTGKAVFVTPQGEMELQVETTIALPDRMRSKVTMPMGEMVQVVNGDGAWMVTPQGNMPAPPAQRDEMIAGLWRELGYLFARADDEQLVLLHVGTEEVQGAQTEVVLIAPPGGKSFKLFVNAETGVPVKMSYQALGMMGAPVDNETMLSDFREVGGVVLPFGTITEQDGVKAQETTATEITLNVTVDESLFMVE